VNTAALHNRVKRLTRKLDARRPALPWLTLAQSLDDPDVYTGNGKSYTAGQLAELATRFNLMMIVYTDDWRGDPGAVV
jgi:hypothetical protein